MEEKAIAEDFFDPAYYNVLWARRYFCPYDINHYAERKAHGFSRGMMKTLAK